MPKYPRLSDYIIFEVVEYGLKDKTNKKVTKIGKIEKLSFSCSDGTNWLDITTDNKTDNYAILLSNNSKYTINRIFIEHWQFCDKQGNIINQ